MNDTQIIPNEPGIPLLVVISSPSGGGKTTLCQALMVARPALTRAITCTTRPPRNGERDGLDYYFFSPEVFQQKLAAGEFLEHATVYDRSYGTLKSEVLQRLRQGQEVILSVDVQGVANIQRAAAVVPELQRALVTVFLAPASLQTLEERLRKRGLDGDAEVQKRLGVARHEIAQARQFDYVILSSDLTANVQQMRTILEAEKLRQGRTVLPNYG